MAIATVSIASTGTRTSADIPFFRNRNKSIGLGFSGSTLPTTLQVGFLQQNGTFVPYTGGTVTVLPTTFTVNHVPAQGLALNVSGGSPDFDIDFAGYSGPLTQ